MSFRNADFIRNPPAGITVQELGARFYEALSDLDQQHRTLAQQLNGNGVGQPKAPPAIQNISVSAQNGHFQIAIQDKGPIYRGIQYYLEHADNPAFTNPHVIHLGDARNHSIFLGAVTRYWRAYSSYASSGPGAPVYFGGAIPVPVAGGGAVGGPAFLSSQGSGTGAAGQGLSGPGPVPFRSATGAAPVR